MWGKMILAMNMLCLLAFYVRGEHACLRVIGVKSPFVAVGTPELENSETFLRSADSTVVGIEIHEADAHRLYCLGVNNKVCFFSLSPGGNVTVRVEEDGFRFSGDGEKRNARLAALSQKVLYDLPNVWINNYMSVLFCPDYLKVDSARLSHPAYIGKLKEIFRQGIRDVEQWGGEEPDFIREWKSRLRRMYWEAIVATYNVMRYEHWQRPRTLLRAIGRMPFRDTAFFKTSEGRVWIYNYLLAQEEEGRFRFTLSDYLLKKAKCIPNRSIGEEYLLRELSRRVDNRELLCLSETLECCAPWIKSRKGKILFQEICSKAGEQIKNDTLNGEGCAFIFEDQDGVKVSSETFRGKYIYLDIWATWCGPCKQEMPYMQKLEQQYRGEKIVFVSLSMDRWTEKEKWKLYLAEHRIQGVTLIAPEGFKSSFIRKYGVTGIPRFMLIGPDGKMMAHNCWRPSDPRTELLLKKLLSAKN